MIRFMTVWVWVAASAMLPVLASGQDPASGPAGDAAAQKPAGTEGRGADPDRMLPRAKTETFGILRPNTRKDFDGWDLITGDRPASFDALEANFGLQLAPADEPLRAQLEIPAGEGVVVVGVRPGSLAEHAGLKANDVLTNLGGQRVFGVNQARGIFLAIGKDALEIKLIREGKPRRMGFVGPEHGFPPEAAEYWIGVPVSPVDATLRTHLPALPPDAGLIVNDVVPGSPAEAAGVKKNDILIAMAGKPLKSPDILIEQIQAAQGKPVPLEVLRAGKPTSLTISPARRAHPTLINVVSRPVPPYREFRVLRPEIGVEVGPQRNWRWTLTDPLRPEPALPGKPGEGPIDIQLRLNRDPQPADPQATARIEAQLKELTGKVEEIRKAIEGLKKPEGR